jgi:hypothetical protein
MAATRRLSLRGVPQKRNPNRPGLKVRNIYLGGGAGGQGSLAAEYQKAMDKANRANEMRYGELIQGFDGLHSRVMGNLDQVGNQEKADILERYSDAEKLSYQSLVNRGFGNSTMLNTMKQGTVRESNRDIARLQSELAAQRANADMAISQGKLGVMERRNDIQPDFSQMIALSQGLGQSGYGGGGGPAILPPSVDWRAVQQQGLMNHLAGVAGFGAGMNPLAVNNGKPWSALHPETKRMQLVNRKEEERKQRQKRIKKRIEAEKKRFKLQAEQNDRNWGFN